MSREIAVESPSGSVTRRQPLLTAAKDARNGRRRGSRVGETAGECAAVCCCCPCAVAHLLILAVYRVPRGIWRKKKRRSVLKKRRRNSSEEKENHRRTNSSGLPGGGDAEEEEEEDSKEGTGLNDAIEWDNEVWGRFGDGFWRSGSRRKDE